MSGIKKIIQNEQGYLLVESLVSLVLIGILSFSLMTVLPLMLDVSARLDHEQAIYSRLFELHDRGLTGSLFIGEPLNVHATYLEGRWCATYVWRDGLERELCL